MENKDLTLEIDDIISATNIMEAAVKAGIFSIPELVKVTPVVERFMQFSDAVIAAQAEQQAAAEKELIDAAYNPQEGADNE